MYKECHSSCLLVFTLWQPLKTVEEQSFVKLLEHDKLLPSRLWRLSQGLTIKKHHLANQYKCFLHSMPK